MREQSQIDLQARLISKPNESFFCTYPSYSSLYYIVKAAEAERLAGLARAKVRQDAIRHAQTEVIRSVQEGMATEGGKNREWRKRNSTYRTEEGSGKWSRQAETQEEAQRAAERVREEGDGEVRGSDKGEHRGESGVLAPDGCADVQVQVRASRGAAHCDPEHLVSDLRGDLLYDGGVPEVR